MSDSESASEILPGVYDLTVLTDGEARYRAFLFDRDDDGDVPTLVDTGLPDTVDTLCAAIDETGIVPERVVITHGDGDHIGGLPGVADAYDVETWLPDGTDAPEGVDPDHRYSDGDEIGRFAAVSVTGHTPNHHVLVDEDAGIAVLGDAVFGSDSRGLPAGYFILPTAYYSEDLAAADESLGRLLDYDFDAGLVYHGSSVLDGASDKLEAFVEFKNKS